MLRQTDVEELKTYLDFFYQLALNPATSAYPTFTDGIKTKLDFTRWLLEDIKSEHAEVVLFETEGTVQGVLAYIFSIEAQYLQVEIANFGEKADLAIRECLMRWAEKFPNFKVGFGIPAENVIYYKTLLELGFQFEPPQFVNVLDLKNWHKRTLPVAVEAVTEKNFLDFARFYGET